MNRTAAVFAVLLLACGSAMAAPPRPDQAPVLGEWAGKGDTLGEPFAACATISPYMDNVYLHLNYRVRQLGPSDVPDIALESFYFFLENDKVEGVTLDNLSNVMQVAGEYAERRMSTRWFKNGKVIGKSEWRLSADAKTLTFVRYGLLDSGEFKSFGEVVLKRLPEGERCALPPKVAARAD